MTSRQIRIGCDFTYVAAIDTPVIFQVQPAESSDIAIHEQEVVS